MKNKINNKFQKGIFNSIKGFTVIEMLTVFILIILLLHGFSNLLTLTRLRFNHQEESVIMSTEASFLHENLRRDLEYCTVTSDIASNTFLEKFNQAIIISNTDFEFNRLIENGTSSISYSFDSQNGEILRMEDGQLSQIGKGRLVEFSIEKKFLLTNGEICSINDDNFDTTISDSTNKAYRQWLEIQLKMKALDSKAQSEQSYNFCIFPHLLNREMQSIWKDKQNN